MINPFADVQWNPDLAERRKFARSLVMGFPIMALVFLLLGWLKHGIWTANLVFSVWLGGVGTLAGLVFWAVPQIARPFYLGWYFLACCLGVVVSNLALAGFYYLVVSPFGLLKRLAARHPAIVKRGDASAASYWKDVPPPPAPDRYYRQF